MEASLSYRSIAAIAGANDEDVSVLRAAASLAAQFAAHVQVIPAFPDPAADLAYYGRALKRSLDPDAVQRIEQAQEEQRQKIEAAARAIAGEFGLAVSADVIAGPSVYVEKRALYPGIAISKSSVLSDLMVFGARGACEQLELGVLFGGALLLDRAPILVTRGVQRVLGAPIAIAWDASAQAGRAVRAALPLLAQAPEIAILQCPHGLADAQKEAAAPERLGAYLMRHGAVKPNFVLAEGPREGEALLAAARAAGASLLVAGGYGRSRLREWALGGATRTFLRAEEGPHLFLCH
jgi:nucleotide-binding universal stress UspA family protein